MYVHVKNKNKSIKDRVMRDNHTDGVIRDPPEANLVLQYAVHPLPTESGYDSWDDPHLSGDPQAAGCRDDGLDQRVHRQLDVLAVCHRSVCGKSRRVTYYRSWGESHHTDMR